MKQLRHIVIVALALSSCRQPPGVDSRAKEGGSGTSGVTGPTVTTGITTPTGPAQTSGDCICVSQPSDLDGDCLIDSLEDTNANGVYDGGVDFANLQDPDTDFDGILDGCEDSNGNGITDAVPPESSPTNPDSDGDGIPDGLEDANRNGRVDVGETSPAEEDDDGDGIPDGMEDRNHNGLWDCPEAPGGPPCETRPSERDTDGDGLSDALELKTYASMPPNFTFCTRSGLLTMPCTGAPNPTCSGIGAFAGKDGVFGSTDDQTCPWQADSDGDGLLDGVEDKSADGLVNTRETNPRLADTDSDGLPDGVEDSNKDGIYDVDTETDPSRIDTDGDGITDGVEDSGGCLTNPTTPPTCSGQPATGPIRCICGFWHDGRRQPFESDPRKADTDDDQLPDGAEDRNGDGVCQLPAPRDVPRASDETCAYDNDSDGDFLLDGAEDLNGNGLIDAALGETDARRADVDNDCLTDPYELFLGTDPFRPDTDEDGLADGLESDRHLRYDRATETCVPLSCGGLLLYPSATCPDPKVRDSDNDGFVDGFELINGVPTGEDENADGCKALSETNPCVHDALSPPPIGDPMATACTLGDAASCAARDVRKCDTCAVSSSPNNFCGGDASTCSVEGDPCPDDAPCKAARKVGQALICAEGNIRPVLLLRSEPADYNIALPATGPTGGGNPSALYDFAEITFGGHQVGHLFQSIDERSNTGPEPIRSAFGGIARMGTLVVGTPDAVIDDPPIVIVDGTGSGPVVPASSLQPSDVAADAFARLGAKLSPLGYTLARTAGGNVAGHDDESGTGRPNATVVRRATDRYIVRRNDGTGVDTAQVSRLVASALIGGNDAQTTLAAPAMYFRGPVAELKIGFYKRLVKRRVYTATGSSLETVAQFGATWGVAGLDTNCATLTGADRQACRERNEPALIPVDDLSNGSSLSRYQAEVGRGCDPYDPRKAKADFLVVIDDSGSMQRNIIAIQQGGRDIAFKLRGNAENLDWRIGMTTSNMGGGRDAGTFGPTSVTGPNALLDPYVPFAGTSGSDYPKLVPGSAPNDVDAFVAYQHTAFGPSGQVMACEYAEQYSPTDPLKSPFCCAFNVQPDGSTNNNGANPLTYLAACCSLPQGSTIPGTYLSGTAFASSNFDLSDANGSNLGTSFEGNDTLRCYDFPRFAEDLGGWGTAVPRYPTGTAANPSEKQRMRHFNDYLCGRVADTAPPPPITPPDRGPVRLWGTRGHLWPPGFAGFDGQNPRRDGANLLIRNADMLVVQMNRDCTGNDAGGNFVWSPRARNGSGVESMLQAAKRAVERATALGRQANDPNRLRPDAPLITIFLSDEEDYATKFRNVDTVRDTTPLPAARCTGNGDSGCTAAYCEACYANAIDKGQDPGVVAGFAIPGARTYDELAGVIREDAATGAYCVAPIMSTAATQVSVQCPAPAPMSEAPFCSAGAGVSTRYNGFYQAQPGDENGVLTAQQTLGPNRVPADWLNYTLGPTGSGVSCTCAGDCQPCMRYLRERPYMDFFGGQCSPTDVSSPTSPPPPEDPRRYPRPAVAVNGGNLMLPLGPVYAITRASGLQGGVAGSCGSNHPGGDGMALRDLALSTGGGFTDICPQFGQDEPSYADFLEQIVVEAQGLGSPYRLRGAPISSTLRAAVMDRFGKLRLLKRSSVSGFDYNPATNTVAFFSKGDMDAANQVTASKDAVVYVSYRVWKRPCPEDCALGDSCSICTCSTARPDCCTVTPTFECQPPTCPTCGPCETCNFATNTCRPASACEPGCPRCVTTAEGPKCQPCPADTVEVVMPCTGAPGQCPDPPLTVCVSQNGVPNTGTTCAVTGLPNDCCGAGKACTGNDVCVTFPCSGESCLPQALCVPPQGGDQPDPCWCGGQCPADPMNPPCPDGTVCAPIPCQGESCPARFGCIASNAGSSAECTPNPECSCPNGVCSDCPACSYCNADKQCEPLCDASVSLAECAADSSKRNPPTLACCPPGETFDPATGTCSIGGCTCDPACSENQFCDPFSCRCLPRGG